MAEAVEHIKEYLADFELAERVREFTNVSTATVPLAAAAIGCEEAQIAKSLSFYGKDDCAIIVVAAGDAKVDNAKFKHHFGLKPKMLKGDDVVRLTNHHIGGVCPFALPECAKVYLDISMQRFERMYPAAGNAASMVDLSLDELMRASKAQEWVDVCKAWQEEVMI